MTSSALKNTLICLSFFGLSTIGFSDSGIGHLMSESARSNYSSVIEKDGNQVLLINGPQAKSIYEKLDSTTETTTEDKVDDNATLTKRSRKGLRITCTGTKSSSTSMWSTVKEQFQCLVTDVI
ncbi:MAG: hypothetical protein R3A80_07100 [Bdellovibrionota bacterium]